MNNTEPALAPNSQEAEEAVIGSILINPEVLPELLIFLRGDDFYFRTHLYVWNAIIALHERGDYIDALTVTEQLRHMRDQWDEQPLLEKIGGPAMITYLANNTPTYLNVETYARIVERLAVRRRLLDKASQTAKLALNDEMALDDVLDEVYKLDMGFIQSVSSGEVISARALLDDTRQRHEQQVTHPADVRGFSTGLSKLDRALGGLLPGLISAAGATSMGKSTFCAGVTHALMKQAAGGLLSTEVHPSRALDKMLTDLAGIPYKKWLSGFLSREERASFERMSESIEGVIDNLVPLRGKRLTMQAIEAAVVRYNLKWLIVDSGSVLANRVADQFRGQLRQAVNYVSAALQDISQDIPVLVTWQIGRSVKTRQEKEPHLNDFKESGNIEEDSDVCLGLYRHQYYVERKEAQPKPMDYPANTAAIFILKDRAGGVGNDKVTVSFVPGKGFYEITSEQPSLRYANADAEMAAYSARSAEDVEL